jgi:hypothetical protein
MENDDIGKLPPGRELDRLVHESLFGQTNLHEIPQYSLDALNADRILKRLEALTKNPVVVERCEKESARWFARLGREADSNAAVFAETKSLAICRLALAVNFTKTGTLRVDPRTSDTTHIRIERPSANEPTAYGGMTFGELFRNKTGFDGGSIPDALFWQALYRRHMVLAWIFFWFCPGFYRTDLGTLKRLCDCKTRDEFYGVLTEFHHESQIDSFKNRWYLRVSARLLMTLELELLES